MQYRDLGKTGLKVSAVGLGASQLGRVEVEEKTAEEVLNGALDLGINFIDTAAMYKLSEERIGRYLGHRRDEFFIATKCGDYNIFENNKYRTVKDYSPKGVLETIEQSRTKLRTDVIDIVQFHGLPEDPDKRKYAIEALISARDKGWVKYIGVSLDEAPGKDADVWQPDCIEFTYNILEREAEDAILPVAAEHSIGTIIKRPIANAVYLMKEKPVGTYYAKSWDRAQEFNIRQFSGDMPLVEFALRFVLSHQDVSTAIVGSTKLKNIEACVKAGDGEKLIHNVK